MTGETPQQRQVQLHMGIIYLNPGQGQTLKDAVGLYSQPFLERPEQFPDILLLDSTEQYQSITGIFKAGNVGHPDYLKDFYNGRTLPPIEVNRVFVSRGFRYEGGRPLLREELNELWHKWYFGRIFNPKSPQELRQFFETDDIVQRIVNYALQLPKQEIRIRVSSKSKEELDALPDKLVQLGVTGQFIDYLPPILFRDLDSELSEIKS